MASGYLHGRPSILVLMTLAFQATHALSTGAIFALSKRQGCSNLQAQCKSSISNCVDYICNSCSDLNSAISQCCAGTDATAIAMCLEKGLDGGLGAISAATSEAATSSLVTSGLPTSIANDPNYIACTSFYGIFENCKSQTQISPTSHSPQRLYASATLRRPMSVLYTTDTIALASRTSRRGTHGNTRKYRHRLVGSSRVDRARPMQVR